MKTQDSTDTTGNGVFIRIGGLAGIVALLIHIAVNGFIKQFPPENPTAAELEAYLTSEAGNWAIVHGLRYPALIGLLLFGAAVFVRTSRGSTSGFPTWGIVGLLGTAVHITNAFIANGLEIVAFYDYSRLSEDPSLFWLMFYSVRVLFTAEVAAMGVIALGYNMAGYQSRSLPRWICYLGFAWFGASMVAATSVISVLTGGWAGVAMDIAMLAGMAWFASVGVFLVIRGSS